MANQAKNTNPTPRISLRGVQKYLDVVESPKAGNRRLTIMVIVLGAVLFAQGAAIVMMLPLKERVPYTIEVEADANGKPTGNVTVADRIAKKWEPSEANVRYFLARWAENLLSVDEYTKDRRLPASYALLKGQAIEDWKRYVQEQGKPLELLAAKPDLRIRAQIISITFLSDKSAMIRVKLTGPDGSEKRVQVNATYDFLPPATDEEVYANPMGLWITGFTVANELA